MTGPPSDNYTEQIARKAGVREDALKVSVHKACDGSAGALHLALNPELTYNKQSKIKIKVPQTMLFHNLSNRQSQMIIP